MWYRHQNGKWVIVHVRREIKRLWELGDKVEDVTG